jgi:NADPH:quinone reductase-like Zn-dependent oxidoreductase
MRAVVITAPGGPEVLELQDRPRPEPGAGEIRVRVRAAGLNRADLLQRRGGYPAPVGWPADVPGLEYAGEVDALGPGETRWRPGDRVMGLVGGGAQSEYLVAPVDEALPVPAGLDWPAAAAIPEAFLTAYDALAIVLIHAVGSGVGTAAVQVARALGAVPVGTARSAWKLDRARELGLAEAIDTSRVSFREALTAPVHVVLDVLGGPALAENLAVLEPRGRLVILGLLQGAVASASLEPLLRRRLEIIGSVMRTRSAMERAALVREAEEKLLPLFDAPTRGRADAQEGEPSRRAPEPPCRPVVGAVWPMAEVRAAHGALERNEVYGKAVLAW